MMRQRDTREDEDGLGDGHGATTYRHAPRQPAQVPSGGVAVRPGPRRLELRGQRDQRRLVRRAPDQHACRPAGRPPSSAAGTLTAGCPVTLYSAGERGVALLPLEVLGAVAVGVEPAQRAGRHRADRREQDVVARRSPGGSGGRTAAARTSPPSPSWADIARPRARSSRVSGRSSPTRSRRHRQRRPRQRPHPLERRQHLRAEQPGAARPRRRGRGRRAAARRPRTRRRPPGRARRRASPTPGSGRSAAGRAARSARRRKVSPAGSGGAQDGSPSTGPAIASSIAAASRTVRASGPLMPRPVTSAPNGALLTRPRLGLMPTSPLMLAGMRIEPPPSLPCANGSMPGGDRDGRSPAGAAGQPARGPRGSGPGRRASLSV